MSDLSKALELLHEKTADQLVEIITHGVPIKDDEGKVHYEPAPAAYFTAAIALLKHNNIQQVPTKKNGMGKLSLAVSNMPMPGADMQRVLDGSTE